MKTSIYCRTVAKGIQSFYVSIGSNSYYLFDQKYYVGVREHFVGGRGVYELAQSTKHHNFAVRRTENKLYSYLKFAEKEHNIVIFDKRDNQKSKTYKTTKDYCSKWADDAVKEHCLDCAC